LALSRRAHLRVDPRRCGPGLAGCGRHVSPEEVAARGNPAEAIDGYVTVATMRAPIAALWPRGCGEYYATRNMGREHSPFKGIFSVGEASCRGPATSVGPWLAWAGPETTSSRPLRSGCPFSICPIPLSAKNPQENKCPTPTRTSPLRSKPSPANS